MDDTRSIRFFNRGPSAVARLVFFCVLSLLLLFVDARYQYLESTRKVLAVMIYPFQRLTALPGEVVGEVADYFHLQENLLESNAQLRQQHEADTTQLAQLQAIQAENAQLRTLLELKQRVAYPMQTAEIAYIERDIFKRKLFVDKGSQANVQPGQVVLDENGVVGQVTRVYPWLSEVTLVTDKNQAVPIQVVRNGLRAVVFGSGDVEQMELRYMPVSVDIEEGDILVTSGIDGTYPPDLPVARVLKVERDPAYAFARITCVTLAGVNRHRALQIVSQQVSLPERPETTQAAEENAARKIKRGRR